MSGTPEFMTHERIMTGEEYVSYSDYHSLQRERDELLKKTGYWALLQNWLDMVHEAYEGQDRDGLCQLYMRGPFAGWSQEKMVRLADELWENSQKYPFHPKEKQHE
jgi:hypothetical protein